MNQPLNPQSKPPITAEEAQNAHSIWEGVIPHLKKNEIAYATWFEDASPVSYDGTIFVLATPRMKKNIIQQDFSKQISDTINRCVMKDIELRLVSKEDLLEERASSQERDEPDSIIGDYTFDNFVVGPSNREAHGYSRGVASRNTYVKEINPLFIHGGSGLGKTHLLYAICNEVKKNFPEKKVHYSPGEAWLTEFVTSLSNNTQQRFKEKYRNLDLLIIDDVHFFAGKKSVQEELFNTFNELYMYKKQIVFTSDRPPSELSDLDKRLTTRFQSGVVVDVKSPDYETRMAIIQNKAVSKGVELEPAILELIAEHITDNVRQIEGMLNRLLTYNDLNYSHSGAPSGDDIMRVVKEIIENRSQIVPTSSVIIKEVCNYYDLSDEKIRGTSRAADVLLPRNIAIYLIRSLVKPSLIEIGKEFGGRDHSTIMNSLNSLEKRKAKDPGITAVIEDIKNNINHRFYNN